MKTENFANKIDKYVFGILPVSVTVTDHYESSIENEISCVWYEYFYQTDPFNYFSAPESPQDDIKY